MMDDESGDDDRDELTSGWGGESRLGAWIMGISEKDRVTRGSGHRHYWRR